MEESFAKLFQSSHLGVVIAAPDRVIDANDAFLRMTGYSRQELLDGVIDWKKITPRELVANDEKAVEQLRTYGISVPFEKTFILRDGKRVDFVIGAVRLSEEPFVWAAYTVDLTEGKKLRQTEQDLLTRQRIVNQLAHELNNPLAALTFLLHLVIGQDELSEKSRDLMAESLAQLERVAKTVQQVLQETSQPPSQAN